MLKLIYRDLFIYQRRTLIVLPCFALWVVFSTRQSNPAQMFPISLLTMALFGLIMTTQTAFTYDEQSHMNRYLRALPISARKLVLSRFASCLLSAAAGALLTLLFTLLINALFPVLPIQVGFGAGAALLGISSVALMCAVLMPVMFRFGIKARYFITLLFVLLASGTPILFSSAAVPQGLAAVLQPMPALGICLAALLLSLLGSIALSTRILVRQDG